MENGSVLVDHVKVDLPTIGDDVSMQIGRSANIRAGWRPSGPRVTRAGDQSAGRLL